MMIAQVMQQLFGPILQRVNGDFDSPVGGDQGDEFAGLMAEGDDSLVTAEGAALVVAKGGIDNPLPPITIPEAVLSAPAVIAAQYNLPTAAEVAASFQNFELPRPSVVQDRVDESHVAANPNAALSLPIAPPVLTADATIDLMASAALAKVDAGDGRGPLGKGVVVVDPTLAGSGSAESLPDVADIARKLSSPPDTLSGNKAAAKVSDADKMPITGAGKVAPVNPALIAANSGASLDRPSGSIPQPAASTTPSAEPNIILQSLLPLAAQSLAAGLGAKIGASDMSLAEQPIAGMGDGPAPLVTRRPVSPAANVAFAAFQGVVQNVDIHTQLEGANADTSARGGNALASQTPPAQPVPAVTGQGAAPAAAQTPAQMSAALVASVAGDTAEVLGIAADEDAPISLFGIEARHGFAPSVGAGAAATSPVFAGAPPPLRS